jgi:hypothetical protein
MAHVIGRDKSEQKVIDDIAKYGWHCVHIMADGEHVVYSFTVGLFHSFVHPELIIFGLPYQLAHQILDIAANAAKSGTPLDLSQPTDALLENYACCFVEVPKSQYSEHVGVCHWYYKGDTFPLYQIVWPSKDGLFPWHPQASAAFRAAQPVIAHIPDGV